MAYKEIMFIGFIVKLIFAVLTSLLAAIVIHELGHLLGGALGGYHFTMIGLLGISVVRTKSGVAVHTEKGSFPGQCQMYPDDLNQNPISLIMGGIAANLLFGVIFLIDGVAGGTLCGMVSGMCLGGINIAAGILNMSTDSETSDGSTCKEVLFIPDAVEAYNKILLLYKGLEAGICLCDMEDKLFCSQNLADCSLSAELHRYECLRNLEINRKHLADNIESI